MEIRNLGEKFLFFCLKLGDSTFLFPRVPHSLKWNYFIIEQWP